MTVAMIVFFASLSSIALLFVLKYSEMRRGRVFAPALRAGADAGARELKAFLIVSGIRLSRLGPLSVLVVRFLLHEMALALASLASLGEKQLQRLAELVSHKRTFEHRPPRSEFLKRVEEHRNGGGSLDTNK